MDTNNSVQLAWHKRDQYKSDMENINRIANAFNLSIDEVKRIVGYK